MNYRIRFIFLGVVGFGAWLWALGAERLLADANAQTGTSSSDAQVCPLSDSQQTKAVAVFGTMMPTFQHPRCLNCHGGVDPYAANGKHGGGKIAPVMVSQPAVDNFGAPILDAAGNPTTVVVIDEGATHNKCQECHSALDPWLTAPQDKQFIGKDAMALCKQMKQQFLEAETFLAHIENDIGGIPFIEEGFKGTRGLKGYGVDFYQADTGKDYKLEPPPISHADFLAQAKSWVNAMGGEFKGNDECGCVPHHYALQIEEHLLADMNQGGAAIHWEGGTHVQLPLTFADDGSFASEAKSERTINGDLKAKLSCSGNVRMTFDWKASGKLDDKNKTLHLKLDFIQPVKMALIECFQAPGAPPVGIPIPVIDTRNAASPMNDIELPAMVGESKAFNLNIGIPGAPPDDSIKITLIKLD